MAVRKFLITDPIVVREVRQYVVEVSDEDIEAFGEEYEAVAVAVSEYEGDLTVVESEVLYEYDEGYDYKEVSK